MLYEFILAHREPIIDRARQRVRARMAPNSTEEKLAHGIPLFLTQLANALAPNDSKEVIAPRDADKIGDSAALHGHDLLQHGYSVGQVVHGYGDICQVVTELAIESNAAISAEEYQVFNLCLDDAIAGAVTAYGNQREHTVAYEGTERLGVLAHELRNLLNTAVLSFDAIKKGVVGVDGSTAAIHSRALSGLRTLVDRSLAQVRLEAGVPVLERISVAELIEEIEVAGALQAEGHGVQLVVNTEHADITILADRQLLVSAVSNLLQNAIKFTRAGGTVSLTTRTTAERVLIDVSDECGGLPPGKADELFRPFKRGSSDHSGLGLGLSIALSAAHANSGEINVRDIPGKGCIFAIDLPRQRAGHLPSA
jgi:signal transduction histidine kinase